MAGEWTLGAAQAEIAYRTGELRKAGRRSWATSGRLSRRARKARAASVEIPEQTRRHAGPVPAATPQPTR
jgi:hypothetical protein